MVDRHSAIGATPQLCISFNLVIEILMVVDRNSTALYQFQSRNDSYG